MGNKIFAQSVVEARDKRKPYMKKSPLKQADSFGFILQLSSFILFFSVIQMIRVIRIRTGIAPCDVHLAHGQVDHQRVDGLLAVERI